MTGAAGLIGGEVSARLVGRGHRVTAGIFSEPVIRGNDGGRVAVAARQPIDLAAPLLGLDSAAAARLARGHDLILHCAATTRFDLDDATYRRINLDGTREVLAVARLAGTPVLHVSTAYVCGPRNGPVGEDDPLPETGFANGYEASKAAAERAVAESGLPYAIARPSIVLGEHASGRIRRYDALYTAFKLLATGRIPALPAAPGASLDFVALDHVARALVALAERFDAARGQRFHLVSGDPIAVDDWVAIIGSYAQFHAPAVLQHDTFDLAAMTPAERRLFQRIVAPYAAYFARAPRFDAANLLALTGLSGQPTDSAYLGRLIDYAIADGFLPGVTARPDNAARADPSRPAPTASRP